MTGLQQYMPEEAKIGMSRLVAMGGKSIEQGAATTIWAATAKYLEGKGDCIWRTARLGSYGRKAVGGMGWDMHLGLLIK